MKKIIGLYVLLALLQCTITNAQNNMPNASNAAFFTVQLQALSRELPPDHFDGLQGVWMRKASDGLYKYYHGRYATEKEARAAVAALKRQGFSDVFMVSSEKFIMSRPVPTTTKLPTANKAKTGSIGPATSVAKKNEVINRKVAPAVSELVSQPVIRPEDIKEGVIWTIQLSAFKYPVYLNFFDPLKNIMEFQGPDKYFKYCIDKFDDYDKAHEALQEYKRMGYDKAFVVDFEKYKPYLIE